MKNKKRINRSRSRFSTNNKEYKYYAYEWSEIDWDYGWNAMRRGGHYWSKRRRLDSRKLMWKCKWREYRTWKYNRKTQYKDGNK